MDERFDRLDKVKMLHVYEDVSRLDRLERTLRSRRNAEFEEVRLDNLDTMLDVYSQQPGSWLLRMDARFDMLDAVKMLDV